MVEAGSSARLSLEGPRALLVERLETPGTPLVLFGAGHVGKALAVRLAGLPFAVTWVDSRQGMFPDVLPANVQAILSDDPVEQARGAPPGCAYVIMTHSHSLDYDLCRTLLARDDACFVGLDRLADQGSALRAPARARGHGGRADRTPGLPDRDRGHRQQAARGDRDRRRRAAAAFARSELGPSRRARARPARHPSSRDPPPGRSNRHSSNLSVL